MFKAVFILRTEWQTKAHKLSCLNHSDQIKKDNTFCEEKKRIGSFRIGCQILWARYIEHHKANGHEIDIRRFFVKIHICALLWIAFGIGCQILWTRYWNCPKIDIRRYFDKIHICASKHWLESSLFHSNYLISCSAAFCCLSHPSLEVVSQLYHDCFRLRFGGRGFVFRELISTFKSQ